MISCETVIATTGVCINSQLDRAGKLLQVYRHMTNFAIFVKYCDSYRRQNEHTTYDGQCRSLSLHHPNSVNNGKIVLKNVKLRS